jgi:hypothetical protein
MMKMTTQEFKAFEKAMHDLIDGVNEKFETKQKATLEKVEAMLNERDNRSGAYSNGNDAFYRQQSYIDTLVKVHSVGHRADKEIDEAIAKLKELTYQG